MFIKIRKRENEILIDIFKIEFPGTTLLVVLDNIHIANFIQLKNTSIVIIVKITFLPNFSCALNFFCKF